MIYVNILYVFLVRRKNSSLFFWLGKIDHSSHYCPLISHILSYINIFDINGNLLTTLSHGCIICCVRSLTNEQESFKLVLILPTNIFAGTFFKFWNSLGKNVKHSLFSRAGRKELQFYVQPKKVCKLIIFVFQMVLF